MIGPLADYGKVRGGVGWAKLIDEHCTEPVTDQVYVWYAYDNGMSCLCWDVSGL